MTNLDSEWETSSGLPLDGATVTVTGAEFGYNAELGAGVVCMNMTFQIEDGEEVEQSFSVGRNGEPSRDGNELVGAPAKFPQRSNYGRLIDSVRAIVDHPGQVIGSPKLAGGWVGTQWVMGTVPIESTNPTTGESKTRDALVFTEYVGTAGGKAGKAKATAKKAPAKKAAPTAALDEDEGDDGDDGDEGGDEAPSAPNGIDPKLWGRLVKLALAHEDHDAFSDAALELDEVDSNRAAQKAVLVTTAGSVWAAAEAMR
jgi:hypothetical protein